MRKILLTNVLLVLLVNGYSQDKLNFSGCMFMDLDYKGYIDIYDKPNDGKIQYQLKHDSKNDNFLVFDITLLC